jgi:hypothetical protein
MAETWRELCSTLAPVILNKNEQERRLELISGGAIDLWSLDSPDAGRGRKYAVIVIDEAAMIPTLEQAWQQSIRPTLTDFRGSAWILSTPRGLNYFNVLFNRGQDCEHDDWASWQMPTSTNPFIALEEIEAARMDMTEAAFQQEYLALFVNWEGSVFRRVVEAATATRKLRPETGHEYIIGCDWGRSHDYTVFVVLDATTHAMVDMDRSNHVDYTLQCGRLRALSDLWRPQQIIAEQNSIGQVVIERLTRDGLRVEPFTTTNASKILAIDALVLAFERGEIQVLNDRVLVSELVAYQAERLPSGMIRYGAPSGQHDDCVMALAIAWSAVCSQNRPVYPVVESDLRVQCFDIPAFWPRAYGLEISPNLTAAIWGAYDPQSGVLYLHDEYCVRDGDPLAHAREIRRRGDWIPGVMDLLSNGRNQNDGYRLVQIYRDELGLNLRSAESLLESGALEVSRRMSTGQLKVFSSLTNFWDEFRSYRRNISGQILTGDHQLQNATRCLVISGMSQMCTQPVKRELSGLERYVGLRGPNAWMGR